MKMKNCQEFCLVMTSDVLLGEANAGSDTYACNFARMIQYWRKIWNERTNGINDIQFPFGFVQVSLIRDN